MIKTLPNENLLRYVYNELPADEQQEVEQALVHDPELAIACADLLLAQRTLDALSCAPSTCNIEAILHYSRTFMRSA